MGRAGGYGSVKLLGPACGVATRPMRNRQSVPGQRLGPEKHLGVAIVGEVIPVARPRRTEREHEKGAVLGGHPDACLSVLDGAGAPRARCGGRDGRVRAGGMFALSMGVATWLFGYRLLRLVYPGPQGGQRADAPAESLTAPLPPSAPTSDVQATRRTPTDVVRALASRLNDPWTRVILAGWGILLLGGFLLPESKYSAPVYVTYGRIEVNWWYFLLPLALGFGARFVKTGFARRAGAEPPAPQITALKPPERPVQASPSSFRPSPRRFRRATKWAIAVGGLLWTALAFAAGAKSYQASLEAGTRTPGNRMYEIGAHGYLWGWEDGFDRGHELGKLEAKKRVERGGERPRGEESEWDREYAPDYGAAMKAHGEAPPGAKLHLKGRTLVDIVTSEQK